MFRLEANDAEMRIERESTGQSQGRLLAGLQCVASLRTLHIEQMVMAKLL